MDASTVQVAAQQRRIARSHRFLIRLGILAAAFAAAFLAGTTAAEADEQDAASEVVQDEAGTDLTGTVAVVTEIVAETSELVEDVPAAGVTSPVVEAAAHAVRGVAAASDKALGGAGAGGSDLVANALQVVSQAVAPGGHPEDDSSAEVPAQQAPAPQTAAPQTPGHQNAVEPFVPSAVDEFERDHRQVLPLPSVIARPAAARTAAGSAAADLRPESDAAVPVEAPAAGLPDLGGGIPLSELLSGDQGMVSGAGGAVADRATPDSTCYRDGADLVADPVRTDTQPHSEPVTRPGFAPD
ncbi:hypothetical protein [Nocardioides speluncae]|uniref:hypothetical protein n=1 Tax=Nocardioides speluncae TaxID=2670337 RepID=UPI0012B17B61|nr:hypothetical protein [Nocardioides speluncae]